MAEDDVKTWDFPGLDNHTDNLESTDSEHAVLEDGPWQAPTFNGNQNGLSKNHEQLSALFNPDESGKINWPPFDRQQEKNLIPETNETTSQDPIESEDDSGIDLNELHLTAENLEEIQNKAYEEGLALGKQEGIEQGKQQAFEQEKQNLEQKKALLDQTIAQFETLINAMAQPTAQISEAVKQQIMIFTMQLSAQIAYQQCQISQQGLKNIIEESLEKLNINPQEELVIYLHESDLTQLQDYLEKVKNDTEHAIKVVSQETLNTGDCIIHAGVSQIDMRLQNRIQAVSKQLFSEHKNALFDLTTDDSSNDD